MNLQPIQDVDGFKKDPSTGAILSTDTQALSAYKNSKAKNRIMTDDINTMKQDIADMQETLTKILSALQGK